MKKILKLVTCIMLAFSMVIITGCKNEEVIEPDYPKINNIKKVTLTLRNYTKINKKTEDIEKRKIVNRDKKDIQLMLNYLNKIDKTTGVRTESNEIKAKQVIRFNILLNDKDKTYMTYYVYLANGNCYLKKKHAFVFEYPQEYYERLHHKLIVSIKKKV